MKISEFDIRNPCSEALADKTARAAESGHDGSQANAAAVVAEALYLLGKGELCNGNLGLALAHVKEAHRLNRKCYLYQKRLELIKKLMGRGGLVLLDDDSWESALHTIVPNHKLRKDSYKPVVDEAYAAGAYMSRRRGDRWSLMARWQKRIVDAPEERDGQRMLNLAAAMVMARFIFERTDLMAKVDMVIPAPSEPSRYSDRGFNVPDYFAKEIEKSLAVPFQEYVVRRGAEPYGLSREERKEQLRFIPDKVRGIEGRNILIVDDITTSGATFQKLANVLKEAGASAVYAVALLCTQG